MIRKIRKTLGLTQTELGDLIGVTPQNVSQMERHTRKLTREAAEIIAELLSKAGGEINADTILGCQLHQWCTNQLPEIKSETKTPSEKAKLLSDVADVLEQIEALEDASEEIRGYAREKRKQVEAALSKIETWREKPFEPEGMADELEKIG